MSPKSLFSKSRWVKTPKSPVTLLSVLALFLNVSSLLAQSDSDSDETEAQRGWLEFSDGNRLSGSLANEDGEKGFFHSDRFGVVEYELTEAQFILETSIDVDEPVEAASSPVVAEEKPRSPWLPDLWYIDGAFSWKDGREHRESELKLGFGANWKREFNRVELKLTSAYKHVDGAVDNDEQTGRLRWFRDTSDPSFFMVEGYAERDESDLLEVDFDYLLGKIGAGPGVRFDWNETNHSRLAVLYNFVGIELLEYDTSLSTEAYSIYFSNEFQLTGKLLLSQWGEYYIWDDGDDGIRNEIELTYRITDHFSIGVNHLHLDSSDSLREKFNDEIKFFSRLTF